MSSWLFIVVCLGIFGGKIYALHRIAKRYNQFELESQANRALPAAHQTAETIHWTRFFDMSSRGKSQTKYDAVIIQAKPELASKIFTRRFEVDPMGTTTRAGVGMEDFVVTTHFSLEEARDGLDCLKLFVIPKEHFTHYDLTGELYVQNWASF